MRPGLMMNTLEGMLSVLMTWNGRCAGISRSTVTGIRRRLDFTAMFTGQESFFEQTLYGSDVIDYMVDQVTSKPVRSYHRRVR